MSTLQTIICTRDTARLLAFYQGLFGAHEVMRYEDFYVGLQVGDSELGIVAEDKTDLEAPQRIALNFAVDDVDALLPRVKELGGTVLGPPNDMPWGQRVAHVEDPDGNAVNLTCRT
ncbi:VOC family protein [Actinoplanes friuliensis]|uniref:Glyoxalase/bleomycin resistance protein/dioxygenase n=1 Tax=Actinoplanes friuliensis DSM 7358 TaxID=1246995 RepID=U5W3C2_9ACTN|nr:VOC family protein [Actinoplanes friuliensis]AGZ43517.1 glyoxalase/bleomycin resistance protein/dioxygenase [Actinoplanes friuliensis DSM 7358]